MDALQYIVQELPLNCVLTSNFRSESSCIGKLENALYKAAGSLGFQYVRYTCWISDVKSTGEFPHSFSFNFSNFPKAWEKHYEFNQYYLNDPLIMTMTDAKACKLIYGTWQEAWDRATEKSVTSGQNRKLIHFQELQAASSRHGINSGIYMMYNNGLRKIVLSLGSSRPAEEVARQAGNTLYRDVFSLLTLTNQSLNLTTDCRKCNHLLRIEADDPIKLTPKQARILRCFAENLSASNVEIANMNNISTEAVAFHLKTIRRKFQQPNTSGHVLANIARLHDLI